MEEKYKDIFCVPEHEIYLQSFKGKFHLYGIFGTDDNNKFVVKIFDNAIDAFIELSKYFLTENLSNFHKYSYLESVLGGGKWELDFYNQAKEDMEKLEILTSDNQNDLL